jgi:hypothetical protein
VADVAVPADGTLTLSPFGNDLVLVDPTPFETAGTVPRILTFRNAGTITIEATVTPCSGPRCSPGVRTRYSRCGGVRG